MGDRKGKEDKPFRLQEHVEWIAVAFVLALTVRCFIVEAYQIPTGSMAPTLYGRHYSVTCPSCGKRFAVGLSEGGAYGTALVCPTCDGGAGSEPASVRAGGGDRILVAKDLYSFAKPGRWDVFVFKSPEPGIEDKNFVKRLVGLPGELVEIRSGQIFVNGEIVTKPDRVQKRLWQDVYGCVGHEPDADVWHAGRAWSVRPEGLLLEEKSAQWRTIEYDREIRDFYAYNGREGSNVVGDIRVAGRVTLDEDLGSFAAAVWADDRTTKAVFTPAGSGLDVDLRINEERVGSARLALSGNRSFAFALWSVDGRAAVSVDGRELLSHAQALKAEDTPLATRESGVFFQGMGSRMLVSDVEIKRDIHYGAMLQRPDALAGRSFTVNIPEGMYLALGDNSPVSNDSRVWGLVPEEHVLGKAFFLFWPPRRVGPVL